MTYLYQLEELVHLHGIFSKVLNKELQDSEAIIKHIQNHVTSPKKIAQLVKQQKGMTKQKSVVINATGTSDELIQQVLETINENIFECWVYFHNEPSDYQMLIKCIKSRTHVKEWYISMTNANAFEVNKRPANCFIIAQTCAGRYTVYFGRDDDLWKRGYKNIPEKIWTPELVSQTENITKWKLPLGPILGVPLYPHAAVNPLCGFRHYQQLLESYQTRSSSSPNS